MSCLEQLVVLYDKDGHIQNLIDTGYGGLEKLKKDILFDFFRSAFDGSGADNFFDAGRCEVIPVMRSGARLGVVSVPYMAAAR